MGLSLVERTSEFHMKHKPVYAWQLPPGDERSRDDPTIGGVYAIQCVPCRYEVWKAFSAHVDQAGLVAVHRRLEQPVHGLKPLDVHDGDVGRAGEDDKTSGGEGPANRADVGGRLGAVDHRHHRPSGAGSVVEGHR